MEKELVEVEVEVKEEKKGFLNKVKERFSKETDKCETDTEPKKTGKMLKWVGVGAAVVGAGLGAYLLGKKNGSDEDIYEDETDFEDSVEETIEE